MCHQPPHICSDSRVAVTPTTVLVLHRLLAEPRVWGSDFVNSSICC